MAEYPYSLETACLTRFFCRRGPEIPEKIAIGFSISVRLEINDEPSKFKIWIRLNSAAESDTVIKISAELVGFFNALDDAAPLQQDAISRFFNDRGFYMLWPYFVQSVRGMTAHMGMPPINLPTPHHVHLDFTVGNQEDTPQIQSTESN